MKAVNPFLTQNIDKVFYQGPYFVVKISPLQQNKTEQQLLQEREEKNAALNAFYKGINRQPLQLA
jgi:hypothetical protein